MTTKLLAYHGDKKIKAKYLGRVRAHRKADQLIQGYGYWEDGRGCAVGCTIHSGNHADYETEMGIPLVLARLEDGIFERLPKELARQWPERFLSAIKPGADLSLVWAKFAAWMLLDEKDGVIRFAKHEQTIASIKCVGALYQRWAAGDKPATTEWESARYLTGAARAAAAYAASAAAYADAAADAAAAYAADAATAAARPNHYQKMADKLIELLKAA